VTHEPQFLVFAFIPLIGLVGVFTLIALGIWRAARLRELTHRERLAMIEKGMIPAPEVDPSFDRTRLLPSQTAQRFRTAGITVIGLGIAIGLIIATAGQEIRIGAGIGGAITTIGLALLVNSFVMQGDRRMVDDTTLVSRRPSPPEPPPPPM
jgi:hypothetical protein